MTTSADTQMPAAAGSGPRGVERPEEAYTRQVDGLFTYCLSVLCDHDAALAAVRSVHEMAVRHHDRLRDPGLLRAWLYSLARYACLLRLEDAAERPGHEPGGASGGEPGPGVGQAQGGPPPLTAAQQQERRARLAVLAWPEAAGTTPQQREALELAVRHGLASGEVAAVLGLAPEDASVLLRQAACEVERTRMALLVLAAADCPELDRLGSGRTGPEDGGMLLGPALRRELVHHVDDCPTCRGTAEGAAAGGPWPGTEVLRAGGPAGLALPLVPAPAAALAGTAGAAFLAGASAGRRARGGRRVRAYGASGGLVRGRAHPPAEPTAGPRFDRQGFPRHRADSPDLAVMLRNRAVTTTVLAAVLAAPVAALWVAHRGGDGAGGPAAVSAVRVDTPSGAYGYGGGSGPAGGYGGGHGGQYGAAGGTAVGALRPESAAGRDTARMFGPMSSRSGTTPLAAGETSPPAVPSPAAAVGLPIPVAAASPGAAVPSAPVTESPSAGRLEVSASEYGSRTVVTLTNSGGSSVFWRAVSDAAWLRLSRDSGALEPGQRITVIVTVDADRVPHGHWTAHIALQPSETVVTLEGHGRRHGGHGGPHPSPSGPPRSDGPGSSQGPGPQPSQSPPSGGPTGGPGPSSPPPPSPSPSSPEPSQQPSGTVSPGPSSNTG
ncbi:BACON domain-containing protein [Peterkaempfera bronchialis]|uniref:BACON domain-containing protein n=1 Tax=Peterkaempfera bronchialis TaxID=2126346 RepID=UPI002247C68A|nr:sigma-70 family RNA polymerase sigma factor [Peterkaempfera bronchialis]